MKPFSKYSAEELAMERLFIRWVKFPQDAPIRSFWENWLRKFPEMRETVDTATELVQTASEWQADPLSVEETNSIWARIRSSIGQVREMEPMQPWLQVLLIRAGYYKWYLVGFVVLCIVALLVAIS